MSNALFIPAEVPRRKLEELMRKIWDEKWPVKFPDEVRRIDATDQEYHRIGGHEVPLKRLEAALKEANVPYKWLM